ncbi:MAG: benzoylformate decarboxylase [Tetragenococcus koreensis]|nr:benzoylformate decarboxylase [Tetragenococcus halophilus]MDN6598580.1 benzoylformate decarboxylase [Tetragenococcus koreensis]MDN6730404.1 benzoylformate decarboxylase [Alkalibacterium sp.]MDN6733601.1 benzoylformate decarboxylase [Tetragenococcus koreensis]
MTYTVRDATYEVLRKLGVKKIFGNPGSTEETFLEDFPDDFSYIETLHEASAVGAADGYSQGTRQVSMVNVHTSAGLSNAMSNIMTASMNKTPIIITAGNQTREMLLHEPWLTNIDPETVPKPFVKWSYEPKRAEDVPAAFMRAYAMAVQEPAGPVFLSIPLDDWDKTIESLPQIRNIAPKVAPDPSKIKEIAEKLNNAKSPILIYGSDIPRSNGWEQGIHLSEKTNIPVWAAPSSERAPFPETHDLYIGGLPFAIKPLAEKLEGHDLALVIGAPVFRYYPYVPGDYLPENLELLQITDDAYEAAKAPVGDSLLSNAALAIEALLPLVTHHEKNKEIIKQEHRLAPHEKSDSGEKTDNEPLHSYELFKQLYDSMPEDTVLVEETPSNLGDLHKAWPVKQPDSFYTFASGSLGWNLPASLGLAFAERENGTNRPILVAIGDGSLQYSVQGLWTASQHDLPILFVVSKNSDYGILKSFAVAQDTPNVPGLDIPNIDHVALAKSYNCIGKKADTNEEVAEVVKQFLKNPKPTVLEVTISPSVPPLF